jgi:hypothetical protein
MEVFNRSLALSRLDHDDARLESLLLEFQRSAPVTLKSIEKAVRKKKASLAEGLAEEVLETSQLIGAEGLEALAAEMIEAARDGDFEKLETQVTHMGMEVDWFLRILDENRCSGNL